MLLPYLVERAEDSKFDILRCENVSSSLTKRCVTITASVDKKSFREAFKVEKK